MQSATEADGRLEHAFRRVLGRRPDGVDLATLRRMHAHQLEVYAADPAAARQFLAVGSSPRDETLDPAHHAALAAVCLAILNLDEALTRE